MIVQSFLFCRVIMEKFCQREEIPGKHKTFWLKTKISGKHQNKPTVVPTKSDSDVILCLQLLSKTLTCTCHLS